MTRDFVSSHLMPGESLVARSRLHWIVFARAVAWAWASVGLFLASALFEAEVAVWCCRISSAGFAALAVGDGIKSWIRRWTSEYAVTSQRVISKIGWFRRQSREVLLAKVEAIEVRQGVIGRIIGCGTLLITGTGGSVSAYPNLDQPLEFRQRIQEQIEQNARVA